MSSEIVNEDAFSINEQRLEGYFHLMGLVFLYYDYILTFPMEVEYLWKNFHGSTRYMFCLNRYFSLIGNAIVTISLFSTALAPASCRPFHLFREILLVSTQVVVCILLTLRLYAFYDRSRQVLIFMLSFASVLAALACFAVFFGQESTSSLTSFGCHTQLQFITAVQVASAWEALFLYDSVLLIMMLRAVYYVVMALANLANILTFYLAGPYMRGGISTLSSATSVTMVSRLMLHLHENANADGRYPSTFRSTLRFATTSTLQEEGRDTLNLMDAG
ncbi:hypothetical protein D9758_007967 [Tetrapyrgos nigripes]|uniref:DUF6533 domain-containing protein n=1 Tax=Tetrapyrgos nigripes TaxID=182062 RepID=A0A8H5FX53_9AGAR|nr:hypothetical protein D9758_007967 [Tetrapyrgos nigripes]